METAIVVALALLLAGAALADRLGWAEFEINPFSAASRAARAERAGRTGAALRLYARAGQRRQMHACLESALPDAPVRASLIAAAGELLDLEAKVSAPVVRATAPTQTVTTRGFAEQSLRLSRSLRVARREVLA